MRLFDIESRITTVDWFRNPESGETLHLEGLYTVSRDRLHDLEDADALSLFRNGDLQLAYAMIASLQQIPLMAARRNRRLAEGI